MIIGQPTKIGDFDAFSDEEMTNLRTTLETLLGDGAPPNLPIGVDIGVLARLFATIAALKAPERPTLKIHGLFEGIVDAEGGEGGE